MNIRKPLFWHQGLFLQPQHFQYADAYHESASRVLDARLQPYHWGVVDLEINASRLASGVLEIDNGVVLFKDGTLASVPHNASLAPRDLRAAWAEARDDLQVYVGVRKPAKADPNVTVVTDHEGAAQAKTRFASLAEPEQVPDMYQGGNGRAPVKTLGFVLRLFWQHEIGDAEEYELLPLARLKRDGDSIAAAPDYAPPCLSLGGAPSLVALTREIRDEILGRAHQLEDYKGAVDGNNPEYNPKVMRYRLALQVLSRYVPLLTHYAETPVVHPWNVYGVLRQLIGEISVFSRHVDVLGVGADATENLPGYDHERLGGCYRSVHRLLQRLLNEITVGPELLVRLEQAEAGRFTAELPPEFLDRTTQLFLVLRTERQFDQLLPSFMSYAKLGATGQVDTYVQRALPGLLPTYLQVRPESLPSRPNSNYFRLNRHDPAWEPVEQTRSFSVLWDEAPEDLKLELIVVRR